MFKRDLEDILLQRAVKIPVIAIIGPRQSGKTTLARAVFSKHAYVSLEQFEDRELAIADPRRFFESHRSTHGVIIDEVQRAPQLLSYMQELVDAEYKPGYFIITGSQNIMSELQAKSAIAFSSTTPNAPVDRRRRINQALSQTLAGRISILTLLPLSIAEMRASDLLSGTIEAATCSGFYPRLYAQKLETTSWYLDYIETYIERDARQIINIAQLSTFRRFIRLCAGRTGQLLNIVSLAVDCGIDQRTAKAWLSVLEASYIVYLLQPHHENFNKRLIKSPKLYFYDSGLVCALLNIRSPEQLNDHYLRGSIIESMIMTDIIKHYYNTGDRPHDVYFWRDQTGNEIDCVINKGNKLVPIEIKASKTIVSDFFKGLTFFTTTAKGKAKTAPGYVIYGGPRRQEREQGTVVSWKRVDDIFE